MATAVATGVYEVTVNVARGLGPILSTLLYGYTFGAVSTFGLVYTHNDFDFLETLWSDMKTWALWPITWTAHVLVATWVRQGVKVASTLEYADQHGQKPCVEGRLYRDTSITSAFDPAYRQHCSWNGVFQGYQSSFCSKDFFSKRSLLNYLVPTLGDRVCSALKGVGEVRERLIQRIDKNRPDARSRVKLAKGDIQEIRRLQQEAWNASCPGSQTVYGPSNPVP